MIGPDEYHEGVDDNAYTNGMAQCPPDMPVRTFLAEGDAVEAIALRRRA